MAQLVWNVVGERFFETGIDHGVLYVGGANGVAWNGLLAVSESPSGGDVSPFYVDGIKYLNYASAEEFEATIEAYTYPDEFEACDGTVSVGHGLSATQQAKKSFGLCYRTKIGNDLDGINHAYKVHLIYNATASPSNQENRSIGESIEPFNFSWKIVTKPPTMIGYKPTAHFVIDSRETPSDLMNQISDILYGSLASPPRLPSVGELISIFTTYQVSVFDAGNLTDTYYSTIDAGNVGDPYTAIVDGGTP